MFLNLKVAMGMTVFLLVLMAIVMGITLIIKLGKIRKQKKTEQCLAKFSGYLNYVQTEMGQKERLNPPHHTLSKFEKRVIQDKLHRWMAPLSGAHKQSLLDLCKDMGLIEFNLKRLRSLSHYTRIDAAYFLGAMESEEAVPELFRMLDKNPYDSTIFIIGRSIAQASKLPGEVAEMLKYLASGEKSTYQLLADIASDSQLNLKDQYIEFISSDQLDLVKLGLIRLRDYKGEDLPSFLNSLIHSEDKEIRSLATRLLTNHMKLSKEDVKMLARSSDDDIRLHIFEWIGDTGQLAHADLLEEAVHSSNKVISRVCAGNLLKLGNVGFSILCKIALDNESAYGSSIALDFVHEELDRAAKQRELIERAVDSNQKHFLYKKFFGKDRSLVEAI